MNAPKGFGIAAADLLTFVMDMTNDERVPQEIRDKGKDIAADFFVAVVLASAGKGAERQEPCVTCNGRGIVHLQALNERMTCPDCGGDGRK